MELREGRTRGDSRVRPSYVPDVSGEGVRADRFAVEGHDVPDVSGGGRLLCKRYRPLWEAVQLEGKPTLMFWGAEPVS